MSDDHSRIILVTGPESAGNRLLTATISKATGLEHDDAAFEGWIEGGRPAKGRGFVALRTMPHGGLAGERLFYDAVKFGRQLQDEGHRVDVIIPIRDRTVSILSKAREHTEGDMARAMQEMDTAADQVRHIINSELRVFLFSYESWMYLGQAYLVQLYKWLGIYSAWSPTLSDGNVKYMREPI